MSISIVVPSGRLAGLIASLTATLLAASCPPRLAAAELVNTDSAGIEAGRYLAAAGDCVACHTRPGGTAFAGGRALTTPFGTLYSANITPDAETGVGSWSEVAFARALREGIAADGTHLYPAFPYTAYTKISDADVHALFLYLRSLKPVRYRPPKNEMRFPFGTRALLAGWSLMFFTPGRYVADPTRSHEWNRGAYLAQGLGHCGACHTPRNWLGAERADQALSGGVYLDEIADEVVENKVTPLDERTVRPWSAANLTPATDGLGAWSVEQLTEYLQHGHSARAGAFGPMSEVVRNSTSQLSESDNHAIAVYLKSLTPIARGVTNATPSAALNAGEIVYTTRCGDCHLPSGLGFPRGTIDASKTAPPLAGSAALQAPDPSTLINVILYGAHEAATADGSWPRMSGFELAVGLNDEQIAALCTYVRSSWGNRAGPVDAAAVAKQH